MTARAAPAPRLLVLGSLLLDDVVHPDGTEDLARLGGAALYAAAGAALVGARPTACGWVGLDTAARWQEQLPRHGIDPSGLVVREATTPRAWQLLDVHQGRTEQFQTPWQQVRANYPTSRELPDLTAFDGAYLFAPKPVDDYLPALRGRGLTPITWEPPDDLEDPNGILEQLRGCDVVVPNASEWARAFGTDDPQRLAGIARAQGARLAAIRQGPAGALLASATAQVQVAAIQPSRVCDPTGAGNAYAGALTAALAGDPGPMDARHLRWLGTLGAAAATVTMEHHGAPVVDDAARSRVITLVEAALGDAA